ncbi:unnamed protein product [Haemonchus placei]|uniref:Secreted protein n=1 Tax=Haemonchus placei TaxID=6290 RepID=A0A0N4W6E4_HAEPC|nr:unnamed protein product [Haemonchus placei]
MAQFLFLCICFILSSISNTKNSNVTVFLLSCKCFLKRVLLKGRCEQPFFCCSSTGLLAFDGLMNHRPCSQTYHICM